MIFSGQLRCYSTATKMFFSWLTLIVMKYVFDLQKHFHYFSERFVQFLHILYLDSFSTVIQLYDFKMLFFSKQYILRVIFICLQKKIL